MNTNEKTNLETTLVVDRPKGRLLWCFAATTSQNRSVLARFQDHLGFKSSQSLESSHEVPENAATHDYNGSADDDESPSGDTGDVAVVQLFPISAQWIEVAEKVERQA